MTGTALRDRSALLRVTGKEPVGPYTLLRVAAGVLEPGAPGQFFMLHPPGHVLPRPMSLCLSGAGELGFLIDPIGPGTRALCELEAGESLHVLGPLGNGFDLTVPRPLLVGGGIGVAPFPYTSQVLGGAACDPRLPLGASRRGGRARTGSRGRDRAHVRHGAPSGRPG